MWELWVTLMAFGAWVLAAGSAAFVGSFAVQRLRDHQAAKRSAKVTAEPGVAPAPSPALALVRASGPAFADREMAHATSATA